MPVPTDEEYERAGLVGDEAGPGRLDLLRWLTEQGFTIAQMQHALATGALGAMAGDRRMVPGERHDRAVAIERSGPRPGRIRRVLDGVRVRADRRRARG